MSSLKFRNYRNIDSVLESLKMDKYKELFHKKILNWDMFVQMSLDDFKKIGVDEEDAKLIYNELRATAEAMESSFDSELVLGHCARHLKEVARLLIRIKKGAECVRENEAVDCCHSAASTVAFLCERAFNSANLIQSDLNRIAHIQPRPKYKKKLLLGTVIVATICFLVKRRLSAQ